ncbi:hypothetical protein LQZ21_13855 [Treponema sp. TIM-1]
MLRDRGRVLALLDHYPGHRLAGDREKIRDTQIAAFGSLLPEQPPIP